MVSQDTLVLNPYQPPTASVNEADQLVDSSLIFAFTGKASKYYLKKWHQLHDGDASNAGFNLAAMLYGPLWFLYRRMYLMFLFISLLLIIEGLVEYYIFKIPPFNLNQPLAAGNLIGASISVLLGFIANSVYLQHAQRSIIKKAENDMCKDDIMKHLLNRKPTDWLSPLMVTVALTLGAYGSYILL